MKHEESRDLGWASGWRIGPGQRWEAWVHGVLGIAVLLASVHILASIGEFVREAPGVAARLSAATPVVAGPVDAVGVVEEHAPLANALEVVGAEGGGGTTPRPAPSAP